MDAKPLLTAFHRSRVLPSYALHYRVPKLTILGGELPACPDWRVRRVERAASGAGATLASSAPGLGLTPGRLGKRFRGVIGLGFREYALALRMLRAAGLLRTTDLSIKEVAVVVGYHHTSTFTCRFRQCCGMTPSEYRQQVKWKSGT